MKKGVFHMLEVFSIILKLPHPELIQRIMVQFFKKRVQMDEAHRPGRYFFKGYHPRRLLERFPDLKFVIEKDFEEAHKGQP